MSKKSKNNMYNKLMSILYCEIKDFLESDEGDSLTYNEVIGLLGILKNHFSSNALITLTDIRIKRDIKNNFKNERT